MTEIILGIIILVLFGYLAWQDYNNRKERGKFINALMAKTQEGFRDLELTDKVEPIKPPVPQPPQFVPESDLTDEEFEEKVLKEVA